MGAIAHLIQQAQNIDEILCSSTDIDDRERLLLYREQVDRLREAAEIGARFEAQDYSTHSAWKNLHRACDNAQRQVIQLQEQLEELAELKPYKVFYSAKRRLAEIDDEAEQLTVELHEATLAIQRLENGG